ncbi:MAG: prephenate dehydrogenase/arogenate dehydrogenase family protein [Anaerovoracaceae bacterium]
MATQCEIAFDLMNESELNFVGGHPMAGFNLDGYENSRADMFNKACFVLCQKKEQVLLLTAEAVRPGRREQAAL